MIAQELIHFSANQRAAMSALGDGGIAAWDAADEPAEPTFGPQPSRPRDGESAPNQAQVFPRRRAHRAWSLLRSAMVFADLLILVAAPLLCHVLLSGGWIPNTVGLAFIEIGGLLTLCGLQLAGAYSREAMQRPALVWNAFLLAEVGAIIAVLGFGFASREFESLSRLWVSLSWAISAILLYANHLGVTKLVGRIMKAGYLRERVAIVCTGPRAKMALEKFRAAMSPEISVIGIFDDRKDRLPQGFEGYEMKGDIASLLTYIRRRGIDRVIVTIPWSAEQRIVDLVAKLRQTPVRVDLIPHKLIWEFPSDVHRIHGVPIVTVANNRVDAQMDLLKRAEDLIMGGLVLLAAAPVMIFIAIAIRIDDPGPILYRQKRSGFNNEVVEVLKFRSMYAGRPADPREQQATKNDPRVTRVGRVIRRTSLDELPQLLNVLAGTMSLVGPRPHAIPHNDHFGMLVDGYFARHNVKPGITGWAQVNGYRGETDTIEKMSGRVRYDLEYIERWSLLFDLKIIILTTIRIWFQKTAY